MDKNGTEKFIETFGFAPREDGLHLIRPAIYTGNHHTRWGYVLLGELAYVIGSVPADIVKRYIDLSHLGAVPPQSLNFEFMMDGDPDGGSILAEGIVSATAHIEDDPRFPKTFHPLMLVPGGWSQRVLRCHASGIHSVETFDGHGPSCAEGTAYCCKFADEESVPCDVVGRTAGGSLYTGPILGRKKR